jgi:putative SOS response-associated peptidase YedK
MCGRYAITLPPEAMGRLFGTQDIEALGNLQPRWNMAPSQPAPVAARDASGAVALRLLRWGLHPVWHKERPGSKSMINARSETAFEKPFFWDAWKRRRCLVPADGFYEWRRGPDSERTDATPHWLERTDGAPVVFAGLWERWRPADADPEDSEAWVRTFAILSTAAGPDIAELHHRCPVILEHGAHAAWLDPATGHEALMALTAPPPEGTLRHRPVSKDVNSVRNDGPHLLA